tara:strand:- start:96 stop:362 length:267 start_codon:yes stop_codon:yes gene_type:complete
MTLHEIYNSQNNINDNKQEKNLVVSIPELTHLVRHLDLLYSQLLKKEEPEPEPETEGFPLVEILGKPYVQTRSWFNPGQGIKQSAVVE